MRIQWFWFWKKSVCRWFDASFFNQRTYQGKSGSAHVCCCQHSHDGKSHFDGCCFWELKKLYRQNVVLFSGGRPRLFYFSSLVWFDLINRLCSCRSQRSWLLFVDVALMDQEQLRIGRLVGIQNGWVHEKSFTCIPSTAEGKRRKKRTFCLGLSRLDSPLY